MIEVHSLQKRFGDVLAVQDVSFSAPARCITGLLGPNGAGKTTTLGMISGLLRPDHGRVAIDGHDATSRPEEARRRFGFLPDVTGLYPRLTGIEHMHYFGRLHGIRGRELDQATDRVIERLEIQALGQRRASTFSHGEARKVALACALISDPPNIVLDEPTNGLDVMSARSLRGLLGLLRDEGRTILFSSHVFQEVSALCSRIVVIARGRVVAEGTPQELLDRTGKTELEDAFVERVASAEERR